MLDKLERRYGRLGIRNLTLYLIIGQSLVFAATWSNPAAVMRLVLIPSRVLRGEVWRLVTFPFVPCVPGLVAAVFAWYLFYLMGMSLDHYWGTFRYTLYLAVAYVATVAVSFLTPRVATTDMYIYSSVFLAFAFLNPNFVIHLFMILPIRMKWLAYITWAGYILSFIGGSMTTRAALLASVSNFFLFFGRDLYSRIRSTGVRARDRAERVVESGKPRHVCVVCGKNSNDNPDVDFRYCVECDGQLGYCPEHISNHEHVKREPG